RTRTRAEAAAHASLGLTAVRIDYIGVHSRICARIDYIGVHPGIRPRLARVWLGLNAAILQVTRVDGRVLLWLAAAVASVASDREGHQPQRSTSLTRTSEHLSHLLDFVP